MLLQNTITRSFFKKIFNSVKDPKRKTINNSFGKYEIVKPWDVSERIKVPSYIPKPPYSDSGKPSDPPNEIEIKNPNQIECMRHSCMLAKRILRQIRPMIEPGVTTDHLDKRVHDIIINNGAYPSPLNYKGFPKSICTSINNVACHGIPDSRPLVDGDILNIDITVYQNGYHGDCSEMFKVGKIDSEADHLISVTELCLNKAISICKPGEKFCNIGKVIEETANKHSLTVIPVFAGHGIGSYFHGPPDIFHFAHYQEGIMQPGMTFTIEPVLTQGSEDCILLEDGWTAVTLDSARTAQVEHTILITEEGCDILTC
ncbi:methionine aminopeptidase 1D, chloroplastic/mitochondrial [Venturia canescens]|uniref:methionine aminopeptidase 1D, chloroplastic/mitochondrial n=1 Tax=Venturia canescens TaxID=32260 RepID=UPI001C9CBD13|nr:methionine aminopeptidase 1D, chloroplastic/mitochondrial [Venturia canescens]